MGSVSISVIMGFDYPLGSDNERGGRGEARTEVGASFNRGRGQSRPSYTNNYTSSLNTDYMNRHMTERLPRTNPANSTWPSSLSNSRTSTQKTYLSRATTEARDADGRNYKAGFTSSLALEHPKQQPCHYAAALSMTARQQPQSRQSRASTVMPPSTSFTSQKSTFSSYASKFYSPGNSYRFSNIRSRFV